jgi:hypothetical protein
MLQSHKTPWCLGWYLEFLILTPHIHNCYTGLGKHFSSLTLSISITNERKNNFHTSCLWQTPVETFVNAHPALQEHSFTEIMCSCLLSSDFGKIFHNWAIPLHALPAREECSNSVYWLIIRTASRQSHRHYIQCGMVVKATVIFIQATIRLNLITS